MVLKAFWDSIGLLLGALGGLLGGSWELFGASRSTKEGLQYRFGTPFRLVCSLLAAEDRRESLLLLFIIIIAIYLQKMPFDIFRTLKYYCELPFDIPFDMARKAVAPYKSEPVLAPGPLLGFQVGPKPLANIELAIFGPLQTDFELPN